MRRPDEICNSVLNELRLTVPVSPVSDVSKIYEHYGGWECKAVAIAQKEAYNEAINDAIKNAKVKGVSKKDARGAEYLEFIIDNKSLEKLKK